MPQDEFSGFQGLPAFPSGRVAARRLAATDNAVGVAAGGGKIRITDAIAIAKMLTGLRNTVLVKHRSTLIWQIGRTIRRLCNFLSVNSVTLDRIFIFEDDITLVSGLPVLRDFHQHG